MRKKVLALCMAGILALGGLSGCGAKDSKDKKTPANGDVKTAGYAKDAVLKIWGSQEDQAMYKQLVEQFKKENADAAGWTINFGVVQGADAKTELLKDASAAADIFDFASDQIAELQAANALYRITKNKDSIIANNSENAVQSATIEGELYAYPVAATTFFMYYDKSMYTEEDVKSLNTMMEKKLDKGVTNFAFDFDNGWFNSAFFQAAGCRLFGADGMDPTQCDFNNAGGLLAGEYLIDLAAKSNFANQEGPVILKGFENRKLGATFTGSWDSEAIKEYLGEDYGAAKLPEITFSDGSTAQLSSMMNFNLTGVNAQTKYPAEAMLLAEYLTNNIDSLRTRFDQRPGSPTNVQLAKEISEKGNDSTMTALTEQAKYSIIQTSIPQVGNFWTPTEAFGAGIIDKTITKDNLQEKLDKLVQNILSKLGE